MKILLNLITIILFTLTSVSAQLPACNKLYLMGNLGIYTYDPSLPASATNPQFNNIGSAGSNNDLGIGPL